MIAFLGMTLDFARVYQAWMTLESATRDAAEAAATSATTTSGALTIARRAVCLQSQELPGFARSGQASPNDIEQCTAPNVAVIAFNLSTTSAGASTRYPIGSVTIEGSLPFTPLFPYPFVTQNGTWTIVSRASFSIIQGRK
jgi:Flp pilus assembly protein TadG